MIICIILVICIIVCECRHCFDKGFIEKQLLELKSGGATMIILDSIIPEKDRYRQYVIGIQTCLFGGVYLTTSWGRVDGTRHQRKEYWFATENEALVKARSVIKNRIRHKYEIVSKGPLLEAMEV